jgi:hypothetical protein
MALALQDTDALTIAVDVKGVHRNEQWESGGEWPFALRGKIDVPQSTLSKLMPSEATEKPVDLPGAAEVLHRFAKGIVDKESGEAVRKVSGKLRGRIEERSGGRTVVALSGSIRIEWSVLENPFWVEGREVEGSIVFEGRKAIALEIVSKKARTGGSWDWGGGTVAMGGEVDVLGIRGLVEY